MLSSANTVNTAQNKSFSYNLLNLPIVSTVATGTATYTYDATGNKLRKVDVLSGVTKTTDYISGIEYDNSTTAIGFIQTEEGKAVPNGASAYDYTYYLGDNLGNTRITFDTKTGAAVVQQQDDYYPFGLEINRSVLSPKNEYLYNKKELQEEFQQYDYGARFYDPVIGRWNVIDKYAEHPDQINLSPYAYVGNNPVDKTDPDGNCPGPPCDIKVTTVQQLSSTSKPTATISSTKDKDEDSITASVTEKTSAITKEIVTDSKTGKSSAVQTEKNGTTTVSLNGDVKSISKVSTTTTTKTPILLNSKGLVVLDVGAAKVTTVPGKPVVLPLDSKLSPTLKATVQTAVSDNARQIIQATVDALRDANHLPDGSVNHYDN
jgi:RHS repeat-associated protein